MEIKSFLQEIAKLLEIDFSAINDNLSLKQYMTWDSLSAVSTMALLDTHFGVEVDAAAIDQCDTVADLLNLAKK